MKGPNAPAVGIESVPPYSLIIPVYEQWDLIPDLLACLDSQTLLPEKFEIILVDNGSSRFDPPRQLPPNALVTRCLTPGSYAARNAGVAVARGKWLAFTDADCRPEPAWLERLLDPVVMSGHLAVIRAGAIRMVPANGKPSRYEMYDLVKGIPQDWYVSRGYATTANLAVPAALVRDLGGFDSSRFSGGDAAFCRAAARHGVMLEYVPDAVVEHPARSDWRSLATKARRVKGGQLTAGTRKERLVWVLRTFSPPVLAVWRFLRVKQQPLRYRLVAVGIQMRIWLLEMREVVALVLNAQAERR